MNIYLELFLTTAITGVGALALGGALAAAVHSPSDRSVSLLLRFTAGVMLSVVCFDLLADATEGGALAAVILWVLAGVLRHLPSQRLAGPPGPPQPQPRRPRPCPRTRART